MDANASEKPRYLGLLNAISLAESAAGQYLEAWADATSDADLACTLRLVAARETSHGEVFCRRIAELGYSLKPKSDPEAESRFACYADPKIPDIDKLPKREDGDPFGDIRVALKRGEFDPMTANLLTWYIAEEEDSGRRLRDAYACVRAKASAPAHSASAPDTEALMACMSEGFARLEKSIDRLAKTLAKAR